MFPFNDVIMGCESNKVHHTVHPIRHACDCVVFSVFDYSVVPSSMIDSYDSLTILGHDCRHTSEVTLKGMVKSKSTVSKPQGRPERVHISRDLLFSNVESSPEHVLFINDQSPIEPKPLKRIWLIIFSKCCLHSNMSVSQPNFAAWIRLVKSRNVWEHNVSITALFSISIYKLDCTCIFRLLSFYWHFGNQLPRRKVWWSH